MAQSEFLCVRCARHMKTCCQTCEIHVTLGDVQRIADYTGHADFHEFRAPQDAAYLDHDDDPAWRDGVIRSDGTRRVLQRRENGDCTFLGPAGCLLPLETRPLVCRLYPFDYNSEQILDELSAGCPLELLEPNQLLIDALDMRLEDAQLWRRQLYDEISTGDAGERL